jgi:hypothetical protein
MRTSAFSSTNGETDKPQDEKHGCGDPQEMHCKSGSKEEQDEEHRKDQYHRRTLLYWGPDWPGPCF